MSELLHSLPEPLLAVAALVLPIVLVWLLIQFLSGK